MKKLNIVLMIGLICALAVGCSSGELQALKEQNASLKKQATEAEGQKLKPMSWYKSEEFSQALVVLDEFIETNSARLGIANTDILQLVRLEKVSERCYLAAYMIAPLAPLTNNFYALVDIEKGECAQINLDSIDYISEVTYDKDYITFHCEGNNVMNGFRQFPHNKKYDIAKNEVNDEYLYKSLKHSESEIRLGNSMNKVGLDKITENNKAILFDFGQTDGTVMAGGMFCPAIKTGLKQDGNYEDRTLYVDFEALVLSKEAQKQIMDLEKLDYISDVSIRDYKDVHDNPHVAVYFKFEGMQEYSCKFQEDSSNGFMDFTLMLK
jgi:hypothetical protein